MPEPIHQELEASEQKARCPRDGRKQPALAFAAIAGKASLKFISSFKQTRLFQVDVSCIILKSMTRT